MRLTNAIVTVVCLAVAGRAQELVPELAEASGRHKTAVEALERLRGEAVAQAARSYVTALDGIEKAATAKGEIDLVAAVVKEREATVAGAGTLEPELPAALPKAKLQGVRKALLAKVAQADADFARRRKQADVEYLKVLAALQGKAVPNSELAKQVAAEKTALLSGASRSAGGGEKGKAPRGKNVVVNGDFENVGPGGKPEGWTTPDWYKGDFLSLLKDGGGQIVRFNVLALEEQGKARYLYCRQPLETLQGVRAVSVSARIRTHQNGGASKPGVQVGLLDKDKKPVFYIKATAGGKTGVWGNVRAESLVPKEAVIAFVELTNGESSGQIDFDDVEVVFK